MTDDDGTLDEDLLTVAALRPYFDAAGVTHLDHAFARYQLHMAAIGIAQRDRAIEQRDRMIEALRAQADAPSEPWPAEVGNGRG